MMMRAFVFFYVFIVVIFISFGLSSVEASSHPSDPFKALLGQKNLGLWNDGILSADAAQSPRPSNDGSMNTLILAANRTKRPDILSGFRKYRGGWDIANKHYWTSVGFTGAACFILAVLWFMSFGLALLVHHCCGWRIGIKGQESYRSERICLTLLILFTCAATFVVSGWLLVAVTFILCGVFCQPTPIPSGK